MSCHGGLHLDDETRKKARNRLLSVRGHVEGVLRMLEDEDIYCVDVLKQLKAVQGALGKVSGMVLESHLHEHVVNAAARGDSDKIVDELMELMKYR
ncbi:MAG: metal-sensitive transcriptional regulator [Deltaproteobacteria bacterium]|nr:metal-sensitive transcriptional regulator [Deltaproteobacteria bacterium]